MWRETERKLNINEHEYGVIIHSLLEKRNALIASHEPTDAVDDMLLKVYAAPKKKGKCLDGR